MAVTRYHLDYNKLFPLTLDYDPASQTLRITLDRSAAPRKRFVGNFFELIDCSHNFTDASDISKTIETKDGEESVVFHPVPQEFSLFMGQEPYARITANADGTLSMGHNRPLTSSNTRIMGTMHKSKVKLTETKLNDAEYDEMRTFARDIISNDFHTHSSGQISAKGLLKVAQLHDAYYPLHLLEEIGIDTSRFTEKQISKRTRVEFPPLEPQSHLGAEVECISLRALLPEELRKLELGMSLSADRKATYSDAEYNAYRLRYPLTKDTRLLKDSLKEMARECLADGITYAEVSFVGLDKLEKPKKKTPDQKKEQGKAEEEEGLANPLIFKLAHEAIWEMEQDPELRKFALRFKHGIPRTFSRSQFVESLDKAKILLNSPYITGIDVLGYEANKTKEFFEPLDNFALWMKNHAPKANLCLHAGENDKNLHNVLDALGFADRHGIYVRIGHGLYGLRGAALEKAIELTSGKHANDPLIHIETNPGSNIALNNVNHESNMPYRPMLDHNIPCSANSDSFGLYQLSAEQLGVALIHAGFTRAELEMLKQHQDRLVARQQAYTSSKLAAQPEWTTENGRMQAIKDIAAQLSKVDPTPAVKRYELPDEVVAQALDAQGVKLIPNPEKLPEELANKQLITIMGAGGNTSPDNSWERISPGHRREIAIACDMLAQAMNMDGSYIVQGRPKLEGVNEVMNSALRGVKQSTGETTQVVGLMTSDILTGDLSHLTHAARIKNQLDVAESIVGFSIRNNGIMIVFGGAAYSRDAILKADFLREDLNKGTLLIMNGPAGASTEKAEDLDDSMIFHNGKELLSRLGELVREGKLPATMFREEYRDLDMNESKLRDLYTQSAKRVGDRYGMPSTTNQRITDTRTVNEPGKGKS